MRCQGLFIGQDSFCHRIGFVFGRPIFLEQPGYIFRMTFPCTRLGLLFPGRSATGKDYGVQSGHIAPAVGQALFVHAHEHIDAICLMEFSHCCRQFLRSLSRFDRSQYIPDVLPGCGIARFLVGNALVQVGDFLFRRTLGIGSLMAGNIFYFLSQEFLIFQIPFVEPGPRGFRRLDLIFLSASFH